MEKLVKENALKDYIEMIKKSWTYQKLTKEEIDRLMSSFEWAERGNCIKGNYHNRWNILHAIYKSFLMGLGYNGFNWRD